MSRLTSETITPQKIKDIFEAAFIDVQLDSDGDVVVRDRFNVFLIIGQSRDFLQLAAFFGAKEGRTDEARLRFANRVNDELMMVRAAVTRTGRFCFDYYLPLAEGIEPRTLVVEVRRFQEIISAASRKDTDDVLT